MKIFSCDQIKAIDAFTIQHEPVASVELMERAAGKIFQWIAARFQRSDHFVVFAGPGNNGGDGLALTRMLIANGYSADVYCVRFTEKTSSDNQLNSEKLRKLDSSSLHYIEDTEHMPLISSEDIIIDSIFGSGLTRSVDGLAREIIGNINSSDCLKIAVDVPSGLFCEDNGINDPGGIIRADYTLTFQFPKLSFMFADNADFMGEWTILPIGLHESVIRNTETSFNYLFNSDVFPLIKNRHKFDHKGIYGHALLVSGSYGKMGAAIMGAGAALRAGAGLVTCHVPKWGAQVIQCSVHEAMIQADRSENIITEIRDSEKYNAIGIGPGLGTEQETAVALRNFLSTCKKPMVLDADALNIISMNEDWLSLIAPGTILTPHPKEFERLAGKSEGGFSRLMKQIEFSQRYKCIIVLKGAHTSVSAPDGNVWFNSTGNPGMATGGSGDVLTGIILSLLAQGYSPQDAAVAGVYLHGLAGDIAAEESSMESLLASDIIKSIGKAFNRIRDLGKVNF